ncbi:WD40/YVTN/BNR-like repeat-containing protein [Pseudanabaena sp. Chao 1811]|uniref:WD40/YVTN/BNR-like repeat-containing protein n=1 Tax=Pseudanabaena sp. Chao 1811 TaxID=2963092 RepID=UPI0022F406EA|nr:hypothetical protein [Pseudanabaena sp. Chao 1811]
MSVQQDLRTTLRESVENSHSSSIEATAAQVIELDDLTALILVTTREASSLNSSAERTRTIVVKTTDGGNTWRETLNTDSGSVNPDELFFVDENHFWMLTQWQIAGTYPTLYWTSDFGDTWQESDVINEFLRSKGHNNVSYAEGIRFQDINEGLVVARGMSDPEDAIYFLQTADGGKTWAEIPEIPHWYFALKRRNWQHRQFWKINQESSNSIAVVKVVSDFPKILKHE